VVQRKSQLAIACSYRIRDKSPETWVFWVHASNAARFEQSCREIADRVKIPERRSPTADIFKLVHDWLRDENKGKWILILDNVDDARFLVEAPVTSQEAQAGGLDSKFTQSLWTNVPPSQNGSILITTRTRSAASKLVEESDMVAVEPMDEGHAVALFDKKLGIQSDRKDIAELAAALEYMPLAIVQAAAYISQRAPRCTVPQYMEKFHKSDQRKTSLLDHEAGHLRRDRDAKNSIIITWQISFDHICETRRSAADLLSLMSFFDRQGIPEALVRNQSEHKSGRGSGSRKAEGGDGGESDDEETASDWSGDEEFENDVLILRNYSFISVNVDVTTFEMHGLVQLAMRKWLEAYGQLERWKQQYIKNLCSEYPTGEYENWVKCQALFPHARTALAQQPEGDRSLSEWALILYRAAGYALLRGNYFDAEKMSRKAMKTRNKILSQEHKDTLNSMLMVALVYRLEGRWKEAEELEVQVIETRKRVLGQEHPDTLTSIGNLASTYSNQGRWKEAEELEVQMMETRKRVLGQEHPDTLTSMANLALTYWNQGRWKEAEELNVQVIETRKRVLGREHPHTLTSMNNLAFTWKGQGLQKEALALMADCFQRLSRTLGPNHPFTLSSLASLNRWKVEE
jgi:tetratricopeptide (TPR) repeat protein